MGIPTGAYCRVSTERDAQRQSFDSQMQFFQSYIDAQPELELTQIYADRGLSGTTVRSRAAFTRLLEDCEAGRIRLVLTKEVSRFARNTVDALSVTRRLRALGVGVIFLSDGIDTRDGDGELRLAILASIAQEESRRISQRVRWGQQRRMEAGVVFGSPCIFGYRLAGGVLQPGSGTRARRSGDVRALRRGGVHPGDCRVARPPPASGPCAPPRGPPAASVAFCTTKNTPATCCRKNFTRRTISPIPDAGIRGPSRRFSCPRTTRRWSRTPCSKPRRPRCAGGRMGQNKKLWKLYKFILRFSAKMRAKMRSKYDIMALDNKL